ncbi:MAG: hypothetical protein AB7F31_06385 [Parachlamydiales bacterium]
MIRLLSTLITLGTLAGSGWWTWHHVPAVRVFVLQHLDLTTAPGFQTLEARYTPDQIMEAQKSSLISDADHTFARPQLKFYPYLLMEVKYTDRNARTREGTMLWGLNDAEMVLDTSTWEKTHGFGDCISVGARSSEFKVLNTLASNNNAVSREELYRLLTVEPELLDQWIDSCRQKKLIVATGGQYRLHFESPKLNVPPETHLHQPLVTKSFKNADRVTPRFRPNQIEAAAQAAFGSDFTVRSSREVYLPVYSIVVHNPDGTVHTSYWNALNGKPL